LPEAKSREDGERVVNTRGKYGAKKWGAEEWAGATDCIAGRTTNYQT
jgi:hypothetical protein